MLTAAQRWAIGADLGLITLMGFRHIRVDTFTTGGDPAYAPWPAVNFLSFPRPTAAELGNLRQFFAMTKSFGLTSEAVLLMPAADGLYYQNGVTGADYRVFIDAMFQAIWGGRLSRIYLGGDLRLGDNDDPAVVGNHRQWISEMWPHLVSICSGCALGLEVYCAGGTLWDRGVSSIGWIKSALATQPTFIGGEFYPSSKAWLQVAGWVHGGVIDWAGLADDWADHMGAAAAPIALHVDEMGLAVGSEFTAADQAAFLSASYKRFNMRGLAANVWEYAAHPAIGDFGLFGPGRQARPAVAALRGVLPGAVTPGVQYIPAGYPDLAWLMPGGA